ncbi:hypothetical protein NU219Hw_g676t1 [Hortaea werneckii]
MQNLATIPKDIKRCILQFMTDPRDFHNLILTCKELCEAALPFYYNTFHVRGNVSLTVLVAGLVPTNPGLQYVRHLVIKEPYRDDPIECQCQQCPMHSNTDTALTLLANLLPHDRLQTFTCDCVVPLPSPILATLHRRQRKLRTLRLDIIDLEQVIASLSQDSLANVATVYICTADPKEASSWNRVLPNLPNLWHLEVTATTNRSDGTYSLKADASSEVLAKLLDWTSQESQYRLHLHTLQVQGFDLTDAAETLRRSIHFPGLQVLGIQLCANTVRLMEVLYETHVLGRLSLRTFIIAEKKKDPESRDWNSIFGKLLSTFSTLEHLIVRTKGNSMYWPDFQAVAKHAASLRVLHLECPLPIPRRFPSGGGSFYKLHKLEQFAVPMSSIVLAEADGCATAQCYRQMRSLLDSLNALPSLRTLQILDIQLGDLEVQQHERQLLKGYILRQTRTLADYVFKEVAGLKALGLEHCVYRDPKERRKSCGGHVYHRGKTSDTQGREHTTAIEASLQELKQIEPAIDVLNMEDLEHGGLFRYGYEL